MALYLTDEQLAKEKKENEKHGLKTTFLDPEHVGGAALATLWDAIYDDRPDATLAEAQDELEHFAGVIVEFQDHYGHAAPLSLLA